MLQAGIGLKPQLHGMRIQVTNVHLPHPKRVAAGDVALEMVREICEFSSKLRYFDKLVVLGEDLWLDCTELGFDAWVRIHGLQAGFLRELTSF